MANATVRPEGSSPEGYVNSGEMRRLAAQEQAQRKRQIQALNLQREHILSQRTSNAGRRAALEAALAHIESQITSLG